MEVDGIRSCLDQGVTAALIGTNGTKGFDEIITAYTSADLSMNKCSRLELTEIINELEILFLSI